MADISITTEDLTQLASEMRHWAQDMKFISSHMRSQSDRVQEWTDQRAVQFREVATMTAQQLDIQLDNFTQMARFLDKYAKHQADAERAQNARMSNI